MNMKKLKRRISAAFKPTVPSPGNGIGNGNSNGRLGLGHHINSEIMVSSAPLPGAPRSYSSVTLSESISELTERLREQGVIYEHEPDSESGSNLRAMNDANGLVMDDYSPHHLGVNGNHHSSYYYHDGQAGSILNGRHHSASSTSSREGSYDPTNPTSLGSKKNGKKTTASSWSSIANGNGHQNYHNQLSAGKRTGRRQSSTDSGPTSPNGYGGLTMSASAGPFEFGHRTGRPAFFGGAGGQSPSLIHIHAFIYINAYAHYDTFIQ